MMLRLMPADWIFLPSATASLVVLAAVAIGVLVERRQHFIARPAIFGNALMLWQVFFDKWRSLPDWLQVYLNVGSFIGALALVSYVTRARLPTPFYRFSLYGYGSLTVLILIGSLAEPWSPLR
ncbi:MAG: hypothetical protein V4510_04740 [bacterium]